MPDISQTNQSTNIKEIDLSAYVTGSSLSITLHVRTTRGGNTRVTRGGNTRVTHYTEDARTEQGMYVQEA